MQALIDREHHRGHGDVDVLTLTREIAVPERGEDGNGAVKARIDVGVRKGVRPQRSVRLAELVGCVRRDACLRMHRRSVGHARAPHALLAVAGNGCIDDARIALADVLIVQAEGGHRAWPEILDDHVRLIAQAQSNLTRCGNIEIDRNVALARVLLRVVARRLPIAGISHPREVGRRWLDFDDVRAEVQQSFRAVRTREDAGEVRDFDAGKSSSHGQRPSNIAKPGPRSR